MSSWEELKTKHEAKLADLKSDVDEAQKGYDAAKNLAKAKEAAVDTIRREVDVLSRKEDQANDLAKKAPKDNELKKKAKAVETARVDKEKAVSKGEKELADLQAYREKQKTALKIAENRHQEQKKQLDVFLRENQNRLLPQMKDNAAPDGTERAYFVEMEKLHLGMGDTIKKMNTIVEAQETEVEKITKKQEALKKQSNALMGDDTMDDGVKMKEMKSINEELAKLSTIKGGLQGKLDLLVARRDTYVQEKASLKAQLGTGSLSKEKYDKLKKRAQQVMKG